MKQHLFTTTFLFLLVWSSAEGQILTPVKWTYDAKKVGNNEAIIYLRATIDSPWHIYSLHVRDGGPVKTVIKLMESPAYRLNSPATEPTPLKKFERYFNMEVQYFEKSVVFQQKIELKAKGALVVNGVLEFMACCDEKCLLPEEIEFSVAVK